ncbi:ABC-2 transporter permease [Lactiplantibacillus plantarum]|uniref:ABC-2 transporter permease n=1 Tax=Lactiplantibacillus plantarum TaxID=1590 RepID=UPI0020139955|nr:ABC-2 transporter permease [Lactiplantibacillus plantarum]
MTKRKLWQLLWRHYRTLLLTAGSVLLLVGIKEGYSIAHNPLRYVAQNVSSFALMEPTGLRMGTVAGIIVSLVLGVVLFLSDNFTNFNQYLFSLPVPRKQIYRRKVGLLIGTLISAYALAEVVFGVIAWRVLAKQHVRINWTATLYEELGIMAVMLVFGLVAVTFGLRVGHVFASVLATFVFTCSLVFAYDGLISLVAGLTNLKYRQVDILGQLPSWKPVGLLTVWVICSVIGGGLYLLNR